MEDVDGGFGVPNIGVAAALNRFEEDEVACGEPNSDAVFSVEFVVGAPNVGTLAGFLSAGGANFEAPKENRGRFSSGPLVAGLTMMFSKTFTPAAGVFVPSAESATSLDVWLPAGVAPALVAGVPNEKLKPPLVDEAGVGFELAGEPNIDEGVGVIPLIVDADDTGDGVVPPPNLNVF